MALPAESITERECQNDRSGLTVIFDKGDHRETFVIKLSALADKDVDAFVEGVEFMTQAFNSQRKSLSHDKINELVSMLVPAKPPRPTLLREAKMLAKGMNRILLSGDWLTSQEVAELAQFKTVNASSQPNKWKRAGKIFALRHEGTDYYPVYALDETAGYRPRKGIGDVISILATKKDGWSMAFWFGSSNSYLGGKLPKDVLKEDLAAVMDAAQEEVCGVLHG